MLVRRTIPTLVLAVLAVAGGLLIVQSGAGGAEGIKWHDTLEEALKASKDSGKLVMLTLHTEWCGYCTMLKEETWPVEVVVEKSAEFECVSLDPEKVEVSDEYDNGAYPRTLFLSSDGEIVTEIGGFLPPGAFVEEMARAKESLAKLREAQELEEKIEKPEDDIALAFRIGTLYAELGNAKKALHWLAPAYEHKDEMEEKDRVNLSVDYGTSLVIDLQHEEAVPVLREMVENHPDHERARKARYVLGFALANVDKLAEAREVWKKVAEENDEDAMGKDAAEKVRTITQILGDG